MEIPSHHLSLEIPQKLLEDLDDACRELGKTRNQIVEEALIIYFFDLEDVKRMSLDKGLLKVLENYEESKRNGTLKTYSIEEVLNNLDKEDIKP